ncbi:MAG: BrxA family protein [Eubacteriales bacterium]
MEYSAGMVSQLFAFLESKKLAELLNQGMSKDEAWKKVEENNLFQLRNATRLRRTFNYVYSRLSSLPEEAVKLLSSFDDRDIRGRRLFRSIFRFREREWFL